jgi:hypothetical protein
VIRFPRGLAGTSAETAAAHNIAGHGNGIPAAQGLVLVLAERERLGPPPTVPYNL